MSFKVTPIIQIWVSSLKLSRMTSAAIGFLLFHRIWCWSATFWEVWHSPLSSMPLQMSMKVNVPSRQGCPFFLPFDNCSIFTLWKISNLTNKWFYSGSTTSWCLYLYLFITYTRPGQAPVCHSKCFTWKICCPAFLRKHWEVDLEVHNDRWNIGSFVLGDCVHILGQTWILWWCFLVSSDLGSWHPKLDILFLGSGLCDKFSSVLMFKAQDVSKWWSLFGQMRCSMSWSYKCYDFALRCSTVCARNAAL